MYIWQTISIRQLVSYHDFCTFLEDEDDSDDLDLDGLTEELEDEEMEDEEGNETILKIFFSLSYWNHLIQINWWKFIQTIVSFD